MAKKFLRSGKVSDAGAYVDEASRWAKGLVRIESDGPGDYGNAMSRVAQNLRMSVTIFWNLHYRKPKAISTHIYCKLGRAVNDKRHQWQEGRYDMEPTTALGRALLGAADWFADQAEEEAGSD